MGRMPEAIDRAAPTGSVAPEAPSLLHARSNTEPLSLSTPVTPFPAPSASAPSFPAMLEPTPPPVSLPLAASPFQWPVERGASRSDDAHVRTVPDPAPVTSRPALRAMVAAIAVTACLAFAGIFGLAHRQPQASASASSGPAATVPPEAPAAASPDTSAVAAQAEVPALPSEPAVALTEATPPPAPDPAGTAMAAAALAVAPSAPAPVASGSAKALSSAPKAAAPAMWRGPADRPGPGF
jgi:hypothetical protein